VLGKVRTSAVMGGIVREKSEGLQPVNTDKKPMPPKPPVAKTKPSFNYKPPVKTWRTTEPGEEILPPGSLLSAMAEEGNKIVRKHLENPDAQCELCWTIKHNALCQNPMSCRCNYEFTWDTGCKYCYKTHLAGGKRYQCEAVLCNSCQVNMVVANRMRSLRMEYDMADDFKYNNNMDCTPDAQMDQPSDDEVEIIIEDGDDNSNDSDNVFEVPVEDESWKKKKAVEREYQETVVKKVVTPKLTNQDVEKHYPTHDHAPEYLKRTREQFTSAVVEADTPEKIEKTFFDWVGFGPCKTDVDLLMHKKLFSSNARHYLTHSLDKFTMRTSPAAVQAVSQQNSYNYSTKKIIKPLISVKEFTASTLTWFFQPDEDWWQIHMLRESGTLAKEFTKLLSNISGEGGLEEYSQFVVRFCNYIRHRMVFYKYEPHLDKDVNNICHCLDIRLRRKNTQSLKFDVFCTAGDVIFDENEPTLEFADQVFNGWLTDQIKIAKRDITTEMYRHTFENGHHIFEETLNFPHIVGSEERGYYRDNQITVPQIITPYDQKSTIACQIIACLCGLAVIATIVAIITFLITTLLGRKVETKAQSFDKNTEVRAKKQLAKNIRRKKTLLPKGQSQTIRHSKGSEIVNEKVKGQSGGTSSLMIKIARNMEYVGFEMADGTIGRQFVTFLGSNLCTTASHIFKIGKVTHLIFYWTGHGDSSWVRLNREQFNVEFATDGRDLAFINIWGTPLPPYADITKHLQSRKDWSVRTMIEGICKLTFDDSGTFNVQHAPKAMQSSCAKVTFKGQELPVASMYFVEGMPNAAGDCGYAIMTDNNAFQKKLLGIHCAGMKRGSYFCPIYIEDIDQEALGQCQVNITPADLYPIEDVKERQIEFQPTFAHIVEGAKSICEIIEKGKPKVFFQPGKTELVRTDIEEPLIVNGRKLEFPLPPCVKSPAKLKPGLDDKGIKQDPTKNAMAKLKGRTTPTFDIPYKAKYFKGIFHDRFDWNCIRKLSVDEALNGVLGSEFLGPIDMSGSSSTGFSENGKKMEDILKRDEKGKLYMTPSLEKIFTRRRLKYYARDRVPPYFATWTLKDELRAPHKVWVPRLFCNGAKVALIEARIFCGTIFEQMLKHEGEGDIYIGINPHSNDWQRFFGKLASKSKVKGIADDIATWDWNVRSQFIDYMDEYLQEQKVDNELRIGFITVLRSSLHPYIINGKTMYRISGMPSGSYITAVINSCYNSFICRACWDKVNPDLNYDDWVASGVFGDDGAHTVHDDLEEDRWNGQILADLRKKYFHMTTTSIYKDGRDIPKFMPLLYVDGKESVQFIKRYFREEDGIVYPVLDKDSISSMINWVRPNLKIGRTMQICEQDNLNTAAAEMSYYDKKQFEDFKEYANAYLRSRKWKQLTVDRTALKMAYVGLAF
jgi:hypothetical protein